MPKSVNALRIELFPQSASINKKAHHTRNSCWQPLPAAGLPCWCHPWVTDLPASPAPFATPVEHPDVNAALLGPAWPHPTAFGMRTVADCPTRSGFCTGPGQSRRYFVVGAHCVNIPPAAAGPSSLDGLPMRRPNDGVAVLRSLRPLMMPQQRNFLFWNKQSRTHGNEQKGGN